MIKVLAKGSEVPDWWTKLTTEEQKLYLKTHPKSKMKVGFGTSTKPKADQKKSETEPEIKEPKANPLVFKLSKINEKTAAKDLIEGAVPDKYDLNPTPMRKKVRETLTADLESKFDDKTKEVLKKHFQTTAGFVDYAMGSWAGSSSHPMSITIQQRVAKMFNTTDKITAKYYETASWGKDNDVVHSAIDKLLRSTYETTQKLFQANGITHVYLRRGLQPVGQMSAELEGKGKKKTLGKHKVQMNPMSSFSSSLSVAHGFGSHIMHMKIPVERVLTCCLTGMGALQEYEYLVLGSKEPEEAFISSTEFSNTEDKKRAIVNDPWDYIERGEEVAMLAKMRLALSRVI